MTEQAENDVSEIRTIIRRQFESIGWTPDRPSDWGAFRDDFLPGATLFRPLDQSPRSPWTRLGSA